MTVLVAGAEGQLGRDFVSTFSASDVAVIPRGRGSLDLTDEHAVRSTLEQHRPDVVVNCAAFTAVDRCETETDAAHAVNHDGVRFLAEACDRIDAHLIHVSTDYVFDGALDRPYREDDPPNPQSVYGESKLAGERAIGDVLGDHGTIVRTSWVCGEYGNNMVKTVLRLAAAGTPMSFVDDQRGCPTFTADLAGALGQIAVERPGGLFHVTNSGAVSWYEFVQEILGAGGHDPAMVTPISTSDLDPPRPAARPANSILDNTKWELGHEAMRDHRLPLVELISRL